MHKAEIIRGFDPSGVGLRNGRFIGLPFDAETAEVLLLPVPWDVTVSFRAGTSGGPENILEASSQLDLYDPDIEDAWKLGIFFQPVNAWWQDCNATLRPLAARYIQFVEEGGTPETDRDMHVILEEINHTCGKLKDWVRDQTLLTLRAGKLPGLGGGDHSTPLGQIEALLEVHGQFGILHLDAHMDLREAYEGFTYSHASIFFNAMKQEGITRLTQVGIRDYCEAEILLAREMADRISVFFDQDLQEQSFQGISWQDQCKSIVATLPEKVYISFDIDALDPGLCPNTGTPVPGGFTLPQAFYLLKHLALSGRTIIGFDLNEVGGQGNAWDGNVGARVLYKLCNWMGRTNGRI